MPSRNEENLFYLSEFDDQMEAEITIPLTEQVEKQSRLRDGRIDLYISSIGGYGYLVDHYIELIENAKKAGTVVRTIVPSMAFSAGSNLAVAGTIGERYIGRNAEHLIHYGSIMSMETTPKQIERYNDYKKRQFKISLEHYKKYCKIPDLDQEMMDDGFFVPGPKAIKWGMADKYMNQFKVLPPTC